MTDAEFLREVLAAAERAVRAGAPIQPRAAAAHAANESAYGRSGLARNALNLFGVKAAGSPNEWWNGAHVEMPTWEVIKGENVTVQARFRKYDTWELCLLDYGDLVRRLYPRAAEASTDAGFLAGLFLTGPRHWATDPRAFDKCARILALNDSVFARDGLWGEADTLVLHNLRLAERWVALTRDPAALRGQFVWRVRGSKIDVRRAG